MIDSEKGLIVKPGSMKHLMKKHTYMYDKEFSELYGYDNVTNT